MCVKIHLVIHWWCPHFLEDILKLIKTLTYYKSSLVIKWSQEFFFILLSILLLLTAWATNFHRYYWIITDFCHILPPSFWGLTECNQNDLLQRATNIGCFNLTERSMNRWMVRSPLVTLWLMPPCVLLKNILSTKIKVAIIFQNTFGNHMQCWI